MRIKKSLLNSMLIVIGVNALILLYQSGTGMASTNGYESRSRIKGEIYYNEIEEPVIVPCSTLYIEENVITYMIGERAIAGVTTHELKEIKIEEPKYSFTDEEVEILQRITESEATGQDIDSKKNICSTIINRVESGSFPSTIKDVVFQDGQFSPITDNRYFEIEVTKETIQAVEEVLQDGVVHNYLYFFSMRDIKSEKIKRWISNKLEFGFKDTAGHSYYNEK